MLDVFHESGLTVHAALERDTYHVKMFFPETHPREPGRPVGPG